MDLHSYANFDPYYNAKILFWEAKIWFFSAVTTLLAHLISCLSYVKFTRKLRELKFHKYNYRIPYYFYLM